MSNDHLHLDNQLCFALYAATSAVVRAYRPLLKAVDLTYPQYLVMLVLWQDGECTARAIAQRLLLPPNAISPILDRLEATGLIERRRDAADRRIVHIRPSPCGSSLERRVLDLQRVVVCRTGLGPDALSALRTELHELTRRMAAEEPSADLVHRREVVDDGI